MNKTQYAYYIYLTPMGKGYGCYSIKEEFKTDECVTFSVTASYCHPDDRKNFSKSVARKVADSRRELIRNNRVSNLKKVGQVSIVTLSVPLDRKEDTGFIVDNALLNGLEIRMWAAKAYSSNLYFKTLKLDNLSWYGLVVKMIFDKVKALNLSEENEDDVMKDRAQKDLDKVYYFIKCLKGYYDW